MKRIHSIVQIGNSFLHLLPDTLVITLMSLLTVACFDLSFFDPSSLYQTANGKGVSADFLQRIKYNKEKPQSNNIKLFDIGSLENRSEIATLLEKIFEQNPEVIGVDIEFKGLGNKEDDIRLVQAVKRIKDKAVFASSIDVNGIIRHSFFCDTTLVDNDLVVSGVEEGLVSFDIDSYEEEIRTYQIERRINGQPMLSFSAKLSGMDILPDTSSHLIRYAAVEFRRLSSEMLSREDLDGCYVVVGEFSDGVDIFNTPVGIMHGATIHAHALNTILNGDIEETDYWGEMWYTVLTCFLFAFLLVGLDSLTSYIRKKHSILSFWLNDSGIMVLLLSIGFVILLVSFAYYKFHNDNIYINLNDALISVVIATGLIKSLWTGIVLICRKKKIGNNILKFSKYYNIDI